MRHELGADTIGGGGGGGVRLAGVEDDDRGRRNNTSSVFDKPGRGSTGTGGGGGSGGEGVASTAFSRFALSWVASDEGEVGPHTAVAAKNAEWPTVARDVRFRLAAAWLSCDQVYTGVLPQQTYCPEFYSNDGIFASALYVCLADTLSPFAAH